MPPKDGVVVAFELGEVLVVHDEGAGCRADGWSGFIRVRKGGLVHGLGS